MRMPWGKYLGWELLAVPSSYLAWCFEEATLDTALREEIQRELARRFATPLPASSSPVLTGAITPALRPLARQIIKKGSRRLALVYHPDTGGSAAAIRQLLEATHALEALIEEERE